MERRSDLYQRYLTLLSELARLYEDAGDRFATLPGNLPTPLTPILGLERELIELNDLLQRARLLTLTGPGGCGKTRLAQELAQVSARGFPDGPWWVDVAPLSDSALVPLAVASVLGISERPGQPVLQHAGLPRWSYNFNIVLRR